MQTVAESSIYTKQAGALFSEEEHESVINLISLDPLVGDEIPGTGGVRKVRIGAKGKGKRGGARVIYYYFDETIPVYLLLAYGKGDVADLTPTQLKAVAQFAVQAKALARGKRR